MSFDIYGNNLRRGHCEVHPHVHEEYPCSVCIVEAAQREEQQRRPYCDGDQRFCESAHYLAQASEHIKDQEKTMATQQARIEALTTEVEEQARLLGASGSREAELLARVEALEKAAQRRVDCGHDDECGGKQRDRCGCGHTDLENALEGGELVISVTAATIKKAGITPASAAGTASITSNRQRLTHSSSECGSWRKRSGGFL